MGLAAKTAVVIILAIFLLSLSSRLIVPFDPDAIDLDSLRQPPSMTHLLGTDNKGRDILARVLYGGKISISVSVFAALISMGIGLGIGIVSGYAGGRIDMMVMAVTDLMLAFPSLLLAIGISVLFPPGIHTVVIALSLVGWASFARLVRGYVLQVREEPFIEAAQAIGCGHGRLLAVHILPQCIPLALVLTGVKLGGYLLTEAALSFLGLGAQPPTATWGSMISANRAFLTSAPWTVLAPGVMITVTALCFNLCGDEFSRMYDDRTRRITSVSH
jgi:peptide/nickel transport system permease protein